MSYFTEWFFAILYFRVICGFIDLRFNIIVVFSDCVLSRVIGNGWCVFVGEVMIIVVKRWKEFGGL